MGMVVKKWDKNYFIIPLAKARAKSAKGKQIKTTNGFIYLTPIINAPCPKRLKVNKPTEMSLRLPFSTATCTTGIRCLRYF